MFGRRKRDQQDEPHELDQLDDSDASVEPAPDAEDDEPASELSARPRGPWDISEVGDVEDLLDLGSIRVRPADGMELRVEVDSSTGQPTSITCVTEQGAVAAQVFAAPRSEGIWADVRREIRQQVNASGGLVDEIEGEWGVEVQTSILAAGPDGAQSSQPARFVGIDGPRWFLRLVFLGPAAVDDGARAALSDIARGLVIARDLEPRAPGDPLPLRLPDATPTSTPESREAAAQEESAPWQDDDLDPFERGPEITEIR